METSPGFDRGLLFYLLFRDQGFYSILLGACCVLLRSAVKSRSANGAPARRDSLCARHLGGRRKLTFRPERPVRSVPSEIGALRMTPRFLRSSARPRSLSTSAAPPASVAGTGLYRRSWTYAGNAWPAMRRGGDFSRPSCPSVDSEGGCVCEIAIHNDIMPKIFRKSSAGNYRLTGRLCHKILLNYGREVPT